ncbi:MAG: beta-galactosidase [Chitinophagaceae bacterium]|nr:beta-galactosidase [Chitinophagaceae bacterium]
MKRCLTLFISIYLPFNIIHAQPAAPALPGHTMPIGAYYYPEHWKKEQWERDIRKMAELGFAFTHYAEFAWANMEPEEGKYQFGWLDTCVDLAAKYGLKVIMCTPTATPPVWLTLKHPEILVVGAEGDPVRHGMRLNVNGSNPVFQKYVQRILSKMIERYGKHPAIWGWQLDNEPHFEGLYDYSGFSQSSFRKWLQQKYVQIDSLNSAWGASFWSFSYNSFGQIRIPNAKETHSVNPHALLDFQRYNADALAAGLRFQSSFLRGKMSSTQWITTNFAYYKFLPSVDLFRSRKDLDFAAHTMYLLSTFLDYPKGALAPRLGSGMELAFSSELARSIKGYTGIMELQPGQINWGQWNSQPLPGAVKMWIWHSFGLGDRFVCTYRFRQPLFGGEQFHKGIMEPDGITVSPGGSEYVTAIREIAGLPKTSDAEKAVPEAVASRATGFLWKQENLLGMEASKHTNAWDSWKHYYLYYENLKTLGASVHFLQETDSFDVKKYPFMVAPAFEMTDSNLIRKWTAYVKAGGHLILTSRTGMKNNDGHLWEALLQQPIYELIGATINSYDHLAPGVNGTLKMDGKDYLWNIWGDQLTPKSGTEVLATYGDQFYKGTTAAVKNKIGRGTVHYIGVQSLDGEMEKQILRKAYLSAGASILNLPNYVFVEWRDGYWVAVNYTSAPADLPIPTTATIITGGARIAPGEVTVWRNVQK